MAGHNRGGAMNRRDPEHQRRVLEMRRSNAAQRHANRRHPSRTRAKNQWKRDAS